MSEATFPPGFEVIGVSMEEILVVARHLLLPGIVHGFIRDGAPAYRSRILEYGEFRLRSQMEHDSSMKQIIPYLIVRYGSRIFAFRRLAAGGESRLHGKYSIGVGGHINRVDVEGASDIVDAGMRRELLEELVIFGNWRARLVGVLNDDTTRVGQVHFGLVHVVDVDTSDVVVRESHSLEGRLMDSDELDGLRDHMETWSQLILDVADPAAL
ncbi:MAG: phosphoesterase [Armatimonadetes bacterium]|nr:phosphoesterase [Armatimonadota bacterium]MBI2972367.1 phosphoesterase [Armatimonadota bacterium]